MRTALCISMICLAFLLVIRLELGASVSATVVVSSARQPERTMPPRRPTPSQTQIPMPQSSRATTLRTGPTAGRGVAGNMFPSSNSSRLRRSSIAPTVSPSAMFSTRHFGMVHVSLATTS
ncbi:hypothetical protein CLAFUW4_20089 [Fulvia fulva]|nr:hypothetical protein CLAFUR4_20089 [Fulvia fulva]KAK4616919.1 hypothetical protein CLAFUR0_20089 [Fulvia fulva]WPV18763.1 hypothetical protein CLAFUW4_20089 [Fulvia fulva]WPV34391.1 hypothetical protein CLAFUW7_20089 [Fulvia fulva]